jgi:hypothetical protein
MDARPTLEAREFKRTRYDNLDNATTKELQTMLQKAPFACQEWELTTYSTTDAIWVVTTPTDMKIWSNVIAHFEAKGADKERER